MTVHMLLAKAVMLLAMCLRWLSLNENSKPLARDIEAFIEDVQRHVEAVKL